MIKLIVFGPAMGLPDPSPFCMKAMALLKMSGLEFETEAGDVRKAPKGKIPWCIDNGVNVPDTTFMRFHLEDKHGIDFDVGLSDAEKATAWAFEKMCEDHLYWAVVNTRWMDKTNFDKGPRKFFDAVPAVMRPVIIAMVRRDVKKTLHGQGTGRHTDDEIIHLASRDLKALSDFLGDKPYFMGGKPTGVDATVHAFIASCLCPLFHGPLLDATRAHPNLIAYHDRLMQEWFPKYA